jgi:hypothetical protein
MKRFWVVILLILLCAASHALSAEIGGVNLPDSLMAGTDKLTLNGAGLRKKFVVKVYAGGLYLLQKSNDAAKIIAADEPMAIRLHFIHDSVSADKLIGAWNDGFANAGGNTGSLKAQIDRFNAFFKQDAKKGDVYDLMYLPGKGVSVSMNAKTVGTVEGLEFKKALFGIWLSEKPADKDLKNGMLGR